MIPPPRWLLHLLTQKMKCRELLGPGFIGIDFDVIANRSGRPEGINSSGYQSLLRTDSLKKFLGIIEQFTCLFAHHGVIKNRWITATQFPSMKEWRPINVRDQILKRDY